MVFAVAGRGRGGIGGGTCRGRATVLSICVYKFHEGVHTGSRLHVTYPKYREIDSSFPTRLKIRIRRLLTGQDS